jgi:mono/diheme cytochrome c family protein
MKLKRIATLALLLFSALFLFGAAKETGTPGSSLPSSSEMVKTVGQEHDAMRVEGEERFRTNCGRCHQAPHKFPPRMMGTIVRHMRVRAMLTDEDMKSILSYMTE